MKLNGKILKPRNIRKQLGVNQQQFWSKVGVTQSAGSRYEGGRAMPKPVRELVRLVHVEGIDLARVRGEDFRVAAQLRQIQPGLYRRLAKAIGVQAGSATRSARPLKGQAASARRGR